ncbi:MAG TPA: hypothetical protein VI545_03440 [Burkholderiales bacterium]|nr:hypothetical protein [Burkholderiales bacterium]
MARRESGSLARKLFCDVLDQRAPFDEVGCADDFHQSKYIRSCLPPGRLPVGHQRVERHDLDPFGDIEIPACNAGFSML